MVIKNSVSDLTTENDINEIVKVIIKATVKITIGKPRKTLKTFILIVLKRWIPDSVVFIILEYLVFRRVHLYK